MQLVVDSVNIFLAPPIHLADIQICLVGKSTDIIPDFSLNSDSHLHPLHQFSISNVIYVFQIFIFYFHDTQSLRQQSQPDPTTKVRPFDIISSISNYCLSDFVVSKCLQLTILILIFLLDSFSCGFCFLNYSGQLLK